jgi:hypothetical protein
MWQVISAYYPIAYIPEALTSYRRSEASVSVADPSLFLRESYENRLLALRRFPEVRAAAGGWSTGLRVLDDYTLYWGINRLRAGNYSEFAWYARRMLERHSASLTARLCYQAIRAIAARTVRARARRLRQRRNEG